MEYIGGRAMGLTPDQKIDLAIAYIRKCEDVDLLIEALIQCRARINELTEG